MPNVISQRFHLLVAAHFSLTYLISLELFTCDREGSVNTAYSLYDSMNSLEGARRWQRRQEQASYGYEKGIFP